MTTTDTTTTDDLALTVQAARIGIEDLLNNCGYLTQHLAATKLYAEPALDLNEHDEFRHVQWAAEQALTRARWVTQDLERFIEHVQAIGDAAEAGETW
jgi:hypothetical protein